MELFKMFWALLLACWPRPGMDSNQTQNWRVIITVIAMASLTSVFVTAGLAWGMITSNITLARAADLQSSIQQMNATMAALQQGQLRGQVRELDADLIETRTKQCQAQRDGNFTAMQFAEDRMNDDRNNYWALTKRNWHHACDELLPPLQAKK